MDSDNFHWGGILGHSDLDSLTTVILGVFWDTQIWTLKIFMGGGCSGTLGLGLSDNFHLGGVFCTKLLQNRGILWDLDQNFNHSSRLMHHR